MAILAYVDPGTGLLAWQTVVAAFVGTFFYVKKTRDWVLRYFWRLCRWGKSEHRIHHRPPCAAETQEARQHNGAADSAKQKASGLDQTHATLSR
jgi:hypothetical protein